MTSIKVQLLWVGLQAAGVTDRHRVKFLFYALVGLGWDYAPAWPLFFLVLPLAGKENRGGAAGMCQLTATGAVLYRY